MEWNVLAVGDVVAGCGVSMIEKHLPQLRRQVKADFTVVNGEMRPSWASPRSGGDHSGRRGRHHHHGQPHLLAAGRSAPTWTTVPWILRPANLAPQLPGRGWGVFDSPPWGRLR